MKQDIAIKWVEALRSGKYKQGKCALHNENKYCCLGVLQGPVLGLPIGLAQGYLSPNAKEISGLSREDGRCENGLQSLSRMNDSEEKNFDQIADYIEANWQSL